MKQTMCVLLAACILVAGCAGRTAQPISVYQRGDEQRNCDELQRRAYATHQQIEAKKKKITNKQIGNVLWVIGGCLVIFPFFFMNLKGAEEAELEALKQRYAHLWQLARDKNCDWATAGSK